MSRSHPDPHSALRASLSDETFDGRMFGVYIARVTNNKDPEKQGRIKVRYHWLEEEGGAEMESGWVG